MKATDISRRVQNSALWAAYGDAMGFMTELAGPDELRHRVGRDSVSDLLPWRRKVGGRFGQFVGLPAGCYSDDTQLRLASCRAIRGDGYFDVEAFARVELPVWLCYALGAGIGSKEAAKSLGSSRSAWYRNFFTGQRASYTSLGGNGAAMRIQPHVWTKPNLKESIGDVLRNAVCTHGHPRGFLGSVLHAASLSTALSKGSIPGPESWSSLIDELSPVLELIKNDELLSDQWIQHWEKQAGRPVRESILEVVEEGHRDCRLLLELVHTRGDSKSYGRLLKDLGCFRPESRGSGMKTSLAALALAWLFEDDPHAGLVTAANALGSDTDTIGTMAGALLGCVTKQKPPGKALDAAYIEREASRLANIASGEQQPSFPYPDLLKWKAPRAQLDTVGRLNGSVILSGLGGAHPHGDLIELPGRQDQALQWFELEFGQSVLARRRKELPSLARNALAGSSRARVDEAEPKTQQLPGMAGEKDSIKSTGKSRIRARKTPPRVLTLDQALEQVERSGYKPTLIGSLILEVSKASEQEAAELARRIAVAWKTERSRKDRNPPGM